MCGGFVSWVMVLGKIWGFSEGVGKACAVGVSIKVLGLGGIVSGVRAGITSSCFRHASDILAKNLLAFGFFPYFFMNSCMTSSSSRSSSSDSAPAGMISAAGLSRPMSCCG